MAFLQSLFSGQNPALTLVWVVLALAILLVTLFWLFRKIVGSRSLKPARNRAPRLAVTDAAIVDDKRRLVLVRRDNVEHLVMIGGPSDIVIEQNIQRAHAPAIARESQAPARETQPSAPESPQQPKVAAIDFPARIKARNAVARGRPETEADAEEMPPLQPERQPAAGGAVTSAVTNIMAAARRGRSEVAADRSPPPKPSAIAEKQAAAPVAPLAAEAPDFEIDLVSELEREAAIAIESPVDNAAQPAPRSFEDELAAEMGESLDFPAQAQPVAVNIQPVPQTRSRAKPEDDVEDEMQRLLKELANA